MTRRIAWVCLILGALLMLYFMVGCTTQQMRIAYHSMNVVDAVQTEHGIERGCTEANWVLGEHPSDAQIVWAAVVQSALAELICGHAGDSEKFCWGAFLGLKVLAVGWNSTQDCR